MRECTHPYKVCVITGIAMFTLFIFLFELPSVEDICRAYNYARENCLGRVQLNQLNLDSFAVNVIYTRVQFGKLFFKLHVWYSITFTTNLPITLMIFANWQSQPGIIKIQTCRSFLIFWILNFDWPVTRHESVKSSMNVSFWIAGAFQIFGVLLFQEWHDLSFGYSY